MGQLATCFELDGKRCFATLVALSADVDPQTNASWVNLARVGKWEGHHSGESIDFTRDVFATIKSNFDKRQTPVKFDYEHQSRRFKGTGPVPSSGKIKKLELRADGDELWGWVEWTEPAAKLLRNREYEQCSPVIAFNSTDRVTGEDIGPELLEAALTDNPFQDGLHAIQLTRTADMADDKKPVDDKTAKPAEGTPEEEAAETPAEEAKEPVVAAAAEPPPEDSSAADADALVGILADATGLDKQKVISAVMESPDGFVAMLQKLCKTDSPVAAQMSAKPEHKELVAPPAAPAVDKFTAVELKRKDAQIVALSVELATLKSGGQTAAEKAVADEKARIAQHVVQLTAAGNIGDSDEDQADAVALFTADFARAERVYAEKICPVGVSQASPSAVKDKPAGAPRVVSLSAVDLTDGVESKTVAILMGAGFTEQDAVKRVVQLRGSEGN